MSLPNRLHSRKSFDGKPVTKVRNNALFSGFPGGWFILSRQSTITALSESKTKKHMLEAYLINKTLKELEARLPEDAAQAKHSLETLLEDQPSNTLALLILARCHLLCEDLNAAKQTLETLIGHDPANMYAKVELAKILFKENDTHGALAQLTEVTNAAPQIAETWQLLSEYLQNDGQLQASKNALSQYDMIKPFNDNLLAAKQAFANADFVESDRMCRQLLQLVPNEARALQLLARIARQFRHFEISTSILTRCVETRPGDAAMGLDYIYSLLANRKHQEALEQCHRLIGFAPEIIDVYDVKAEVLYKLGRYEEAIAIYRELSELPEKRTLSLLHLGKVLKTVGEIPQAISCFHQVTEDETISGQAYWELANLKTYRFSADETSSMQQLIGPDEAPGINKALTRFALGKALEDTQQFAESFEHYQSANSAYTRLQPTGYTSQNSKTKSFFTSEYFSAQKENGNDSEAPVFVVGLPRSGSTLVEQILSSHSQVDATVELAEIISIARELNNPNQQDQGQYPGTMAKLTATQILDLAQRYLDYAQTYRQQAPRFIDKAPGNFHYIGLIKTLFPNAKIIDIRRNPMASGWSLYKHFFADSFMFSYDLATIGKYYKDYIELMDHWHTVLPGQILTIQYEDLINDLPGTVNGMLQYCGLVFEDACLDFHMNKRAVATPSSEQVRQPLYSDAIEHWKNYEEFLTPLKDAIGK
jgi:tetratricopeptide (TPR) repeat protein